MQYIICIQYILFTVPYPVANNEWMQEKCTVNVCEMKKNGVHGINPKRYLNHKYLYLKH